MYIYKVRLAIIDCGTNTFNLLIVDTQSEGKYNRVYNTRISVKLGESTINKGFIAEGPFERGINALKSFSLLIKEYEVEKVLAIGTSAIRDAANKKDFVDAAFKRANIELTVIDGEREAELIYLGNIEALDLNDEVTLIMDIGGGSTEFILANGSQMLWKKSFNLGAARLIEKFRPSDPISEEEVDAINKYLTENLEPVFEAVKKYPPTELVGSSGAFDSIIEMISGELAGESLRNDKTGYEIDIEKYHHIAALVKKSTIEQRKHIKGLLPMRFDMIVISCLLIDFTLRSFKINKMRVSTYSLKEGALRDFIKGS